MPTHLAASPQHMVERLCLSGERVILSRLRLGGRRSRKINL